MFEIVFVLGIMALVCIAVVSLVAVSVRNSSYSEVKSRAEVYAQEAIEWLRNEKEKDWNFFLGHSGEYSMPQTYCLKNLSWTINVACYSTDKIANTPFIRQVKLRNIENIVGGKVKIAVEAEVSVVWTDAKGYHESRVITDFVNLKNL